MSPLSRFVRYALPPLLWAVAIFAVSSLSRPPGPPLVLGLDKVVHFTVYGVVGLLTARARCAYGLAPGRAALGAVLLSARYAVSDEVHQAFVPLRSSDPADWLADLLGAALAARLWWAHARQTQSSQQGSR